MSIAELKQEMHNQIDILTDKNDIEDLYDTINRFFSYRDTNFDNSSPEMLEMLGKSLNYLNSKDFKGISADEALNRIDKWLTK